MRYRHSLLLFFVITAVFSVQLIGANVLFRFAIDFNVKTGDSSEEDRHINKTIIFDNDHITVKDNINSIEEGDELNQSTTGSSTAGPSTSMTEVWAQQQNLNSVTDEKLQRTRSALEKLNRELAPVVGRSDFVAAKIKRITHYLNKVDEVEASVTNKFDTLREFIDLVDKLKQPPSIEVGGERSMEHMLMSLALQKYDIEKLQGEMQQQVFNAEEAWQRYVKTKLIEVAI